MQISKKFHRSIVFTKTPLRKKFKYQEIFQIFPATLEGMPYSKTQRHYPCILEFWITQNEHVNVDTEFEELKDSYAETGAIINKEEKILSLLSLISNNLFFRYNDFTGIWGMPILKDDPGEEANSWSSKWCWPHFFFPEMPRQMQITSFSEIQIPTINFRPHTLYYTKDPNLDFHSDREIEFPSTATEILDAYYCLEDSSQKIVDSAIAHSISSMEFRLLKKTLSLLCSFSAVETMVNLEFQDSHIEKCDYCGQLKYSIAKKFRDFLLKYVATSNESKKKFNSYYLLRSKIVHTGRRLKSEKLYSGVSMTEQDADLLTLVEVLQISKFSILNWLLITHRSK